MFEEYDILYKSIKKEIDNRLKDFDKIKSKHNWHQIYIELCFCVLTPQSKAVNAWKAIETLVENDLLFKGNAEQISEYLNIVRFKNNKAKYLVNLRDKYYNNTDIIDVLYSNKSIYEIREWLIDNIQGYGRKEASHFLRNIGFYEDIAILDRHILKNLNKLNVISEIPKSITKNYYLETEKKMKVFSDKINIPISHLDFLFWYKEAKKIFK